MDKLRSLHYFVAAAEQGSLSGAARRLGISVAAVSRPISALERALGTRLFERHAKGLALTASGVAYRDACQQALALIDDATEQLKAAQAIARGTVVVGVQHNIAIQPLAAALPRFNAMYPEIQVDLRYLLSVDAAQSPGVDVFLLLGWPQASDLVLRRVGAAGFIVCAAPSYLATHGIPRHPQELERHQCLTVRGNAGALLDLWRFRRGTEDAEIQVRGWLLGDNVHGDVLVRAALGGAGVARIPDWSNHEYLARGELIPVLEDWESLDVPPVNLMYRPSVRRTPRVRCLIDFVTQLFSTIDRQRSRTVLVAAPPRWSKGHYLRASATVGKTR